MTFGTSAVRNLIRIVDMQPVFFYLVGMISVLVTRRGRRLGDIVAGTIVVREDARERRARRPECTSQGDAGAGSRAAHAAERGRVRGARPIRRALGDARRAEARGAGAAARGAIRSRAGRRRAPTRSAPARAVRARAPRARGGRGLARRDGCGARAPGTHRGGKPALERLRLTSRASAAARAALARRERRPRVRGGVPRAVGGSRAAAHRGGRPLARRAVPARPARRRRAQHPLPRPRHAAPRRDPVPLHRGTARGPALGAADRAGRAAVVRAGDHRGGERGADADARVGDAAPRHAQARRGRRPARQDGRGLHRRSTAVPPRDGVGDHRQQRAGDLRDLRRRRHGRA